MTKINYVDDVFKNSVIATMSSIDNATSTDELLSILNKTYAKDKKVALFTLCMNFFKRCESADLQLYSIDTKKFLEDFQLYIKTDFDTRDINILEKNNLIDNQNLQNNLKDILIMYSAIYDIDIERDKPTYLNIAALKGLSNLAKNGKIENPKILESSLQGMYNSQQIKEKQKTTDNSMLMIMNLQKQLLEIMGSEPEFNQYMDFDNYKSVHKILASRKPYTQTIKNNKKK